MNEQAKFQAWWDEKGFNSVILRAAAWTAWMARAELKEPLPTAKQCAACDAPAEPGTVGCKDCNEYATAICSPEPQPAKTRVRLWMRCDSGQFGSAVVASTFEKTGDWQEIHHDANGFYVEGQQ